jgi:amino acid permease
MLPEQLIFPIIFIVFIASMLLIAEKYFMPKNSPSVIRIRRIGLVIELLIIGVIFYCQYAFGNYQAKGFDILISYASAWAFQILIGEIIIAELKKLKSPNQADRDLFKQYTSPTNRIVSAALVFLFSLFLLLSKIILK